MEDSPNRLHLEDLEPSAVSVVSSAKSRNVHEDRAVSAPDIGGFKRPSLTAEFTSIAMPGEIVSQHSLAMDSFTTAASTLSLEDFCKICHCGTEQNMPLIAPCFCTGSLKYVHQECLQRWIKSSDIKRCELCKYPFTMQSKVKPFCQWEKLDMTSLERRKLFCSVTFHIIAITCVIWSLYVLIDRTATEIKNGQLQWPFWTKLVVVAIGFTGGLVFMYIQCKVYVHLCRKWKAYNRIIVVQEAPEGIHKTRCNFDTSSLKDCEPVPEQQRDSSTSTGRGDMGSAMARRPSAPTVPTSDTPNNPLSASSSHSSEAKKTNAETQTALRGVSIKEVIRTDTNVQESGDLATSGNNEQLNVVTVSKILEDMSTKEKGAIFFTECDNDDDNDSIDDPASIVDLAQPANDESGDFNNLVTSQTSESLSSKDSKTSKGTNEPLLPGQSSHEGSNSNLAGATGTTTETSIDM